MRAPILLRQLARSTISGSRAAFSITRRAVGERCRHQRGVGAADRDFGKDDLAAFEPARRVCDDVAGVDVDFRAEPFQRHDQKIDRTRADGAAAGQRHARLAHARDQRRHHPEACAHLGDELIGRGGVDNVGGGNLQGLAVIGGLAGALAADRDVDAVIAEDPLQQRDVGEPGHIVERQGLVGQEARDHQGKRGVLRSRDRDRAVQPPPAENANTIHDAPCGPNLGSSARASIGASYKRALGLPRSLTSEHVKFQKH